MTTSNVSIISDDLLFNNIFTIGARFIATIIEAVKNATFHIRDRSTNLVSVVWKKLYKEYHKAKKKKDNPIETVFKGKYFAAPC